MKKNYKGELKIGNEVKFNQIPIGHFCTEGIHIFESVKSGEVIASFEPEYSIGQITIDYFKNDFTYLGTKEIADKFISLLEKECS